MTSAISEGFCETTGSVARAAGVLPETVRAYCDAELVEFIRLANGVRMFKPSAIDRVRAVHAARRRRGAQSAA
jgi:DNA-binding transcriptional MerR regulator